MQDMQETWVRSLGWKDPLEKEMATQSSIVAWIIPWSKELAAIVHGFAESDTTEVTEYKVSIPLSLFGSMVFKFIVQENKFGNFKRAPLWPLYF